MSKMWSIKYRPRKLSEVLGQQHVVKYFRILLSSYFREGKALPSGALFGGKSGVGKTTMARVIAATLNCPNRIGDEPCGVCDVCKSIIKGTGGIIEIDSAFFGKADQVRELRGQLSYHTFLNYQVVILDECHALSQRSFDILLKLLEDPPEKVFFILVTTEAYKVKETIKSRLLEFSFKSLEWSKVKVFLEGILKKENIEFEDGVINQVYFLSGRNLREAIVMLEQLSVLGVGKITKGLIVENYGDIFVFSRIVKELKSGDYDKALNLFKQFSKLQPNLEMFMDGFIATLGDLLRKSLKTGEGESSVYVKMLKCCYQFVQKVRILGAEAAVRLLFFEIIDSLGLLVKSKENNRISKKDVIETLTKGW